MVDGRCEERFQCYCSWKTREFACECSLAIPSVALFSPPWRTYHCPSSGRWSPPPRQHSSTCTVDRPDKRHHSSPTTNSSAPPATRAPTDASTNSSPGSFSNLHRAQLPPVNRSYYLIDGSQCSMDAFVICSIGSLQGHEKSTGPKLHLLVGIYVV